jgi:hypothetical protein
MNTFKLAGLSLMTLGLIFATATQAEETAAEKVTAATNKSVDSARKAYRQIDNKTCELINDEIRCLSKKMMNKAKNITDSVKTEAKEIKNKID